MAWRSRASPTVRLSSRRSLPDYQRSLRQAAAYGRQLGPVLSGVEGLAEITLAFFVEQVDDANRTKYEAVYVDAETGVRVAPVFVQTGK